MSQYRNTKNKYLYIVILIILLFVVWRIFSWVRVFRGSIVPIYPDSISLALNSKQSLIKKIISMQTEIDANSSSLLSLSVLEKENISLKNELGRVVDKKGILARIIVPPNRSIYDTVVIDIGKNDGIFIGQSVYAFGSIALGTISDVDSNTATVLLYSTPGRETVGSISDSDMSITLIGRGGGEYEVRMPRDIVFNQGSIITEQNITSNALATIQKIITDPRDPFQKLLAKAPVNLQTLKWVVVR